MWPGCLHLEQSRDFFVGGAEGVGVAEEPPVVCDTDGTVAGEVARCVEALARVTSGLGHTLSQTSSEQYSEM